MKKLLLVLAALLILPVAVFANQIIPAECTLDKQADTATHAFCGICTNEDVKQPASRTSFGVGSTVYTFNVTDDMKGNIGKETFSFKQAGMPGKTRWMTTYSCNEKTPTEYCLMLTCNAETEFCSTVCWSAGRYEIKADATGRKAVRSQLSRNMLFNGFSQRNASVMKSLPTREKDTVTRTDAKEDMDRDDFVGIVRTLVQEKTKREKK